MSELKKVFRPELLNRIDEVIVFHKLEKSEILQVVDMMMKRVREEMAKHGVVIELTDEARELLVEQGYDPAMGARPLRSAIQRMIEDPLADFILGRELSPNSTIIVDRRENPVDDEPPVEIRVIEGTPVLRRWAAVGRRRTTTPRARTRSGRGRNALGRIAAAPDHSVRDVADDRRSGTRQPVRLRAGDRARQRLVGRPRHGADASASSSFSISRERASSPRTRRGPRRASCAGSSRRPRATRRTSTSSVSRPTSEERDRARPV